MHTHRRVITQKVAQPALGADFSFIPAAGDRVRLLALTAILTTSAVVAARQPGISLSDQSAGIYWASDAINPQAASLAVRYSWAIGTGVAEQATIVTGERITLPLPHLWLGTDDTVASSTLAIDVGDRWSAIVWRGLVGDEWAEAEELAALAQAFTAAVG